MATMARRGAQRVCFMCAHMGRPFTSHSMVLRATTTEHELQHSFYTPEFRPDHPPPSQFSSSTTISDVIRTAETGDASSRTKRTKKARAPRKSTKGKGKAKAVAQVEPDLDAETTPIVLREPKEDGASETFLRSLSNTPQDPTLSELERFKPTVQPKLTGTQYAAAWNAALDSLRKSFNAKQMKTMCEEALVGTTRAIPKTKNAMCELVLELAWGWKNPEEVAAEEKERNELHAKSYTMQPNEFFILLGRDGSNLLKLSVELHVRVSVRQQEDGLLLRVEGLKPAIAQWEEMMVNFRGQTYHEQVVDPSPDGLQKDLLQRISKVSGAFVDSVETGKLQISARDERDLKSAKRLIMRAAAIDIRESSIPLLVHRLPNRDAVSYLPRKYALYPFLAPRSLVWTMGTSGAFRARKVSEWLSADDEYSQEYGLLNGHIVTFAAREMDLRKSLLNNTDVLTPSQSRQITASVGNILFTSRVPSTQRATLSSPLEDPVTFGELIRWVSNTSHQYKSTFVPDLPTALLNVLPSESTPINRLIYRAAPENIHQTPERARTITFELVIPDLKIDAVQSGRIPELDLAQAVCRIGSESTVDVLMPDRPMDVRFSAFDFETCTIEDVPSELANYAWQLKPFFEDVSSTLQQPTPPLHIEHDGVQYTLDTSSSVRRRHGEFSPPAGHGWGMFEATRMVTENAMDAEGSQKASSCQVNCDDVATERGWRTFMRHCDRLTMRLPRTTATSMKEDFDEWST